MDNNLIFYQCQDCGLQYNAKSLIPLIQKGEMIQDVRDDNFQINSTCECGCFASIWIRQEDAKIVLKLLRNSEPSIKGTSSDMFQVAGDDLKPIMYQSEPSVEQWDENDEDFSDYFDEPEEDYTLVPVEDPVPPSYQPSPQQSGFYQPPLQQSGFYQTQQQPDFYQPQQQPAGFYQPQQQPDFYQPQQQQPVFYQPHSQEPPPSFEVPISGVAPNNQIESFKAAIRNIDRKIPEMNRTPLIREELKKIVKFPNSDKSVCFKMLKEEFGYTAREMEAFRKDLTDITKEAEKDEKKAEIESVKNRLAKPPKVLSDQERQEALAFLQDPNLINNISRDIKFAGGVVGEEVNKMMLYFAATSRKLEKPISLVIYGKSSSGKSYMANAIEKFIPSEDKLILSSATTRAFEYLGGILKHKFLLVQEWEGVEKVLSTIRILQSEGRLAHLVPEKKSEESTYVSTNHSFECPCCVVFTTTKEEINHENETRVFKLQTDDSIAQTQNIVSQTILNANINNKCDKNERERIFNLHRNAQRLLEPIEVSIPFAQHLDFPVRATRNRRDSERFMQLIKTVAFLRQKQKEIKIHNGKQNIEADLYDYEVAYNYGIRVLSDTLDPISDRSRNVLRVCCELMDDLKREGQALFTVNQIQKKASDLGFDFENRQQLYKHLDTLVEWEFLELDQPKQKGKKSFTVTFNYFRDQNGNIINIGSRDIKEITTPPQLYEKLRNDPYEVMF